MPPETSPEQSHAMLQSLLMERSKWRPIRKPTMERSFSVGPS
jgi:hypothetical protein